MGLQKLITSTDCAFPSLSGVLRIFRHTQDGVPHFKQDKLACYVKEIIELHSLL